MDFDMQDKLLVDPAAALASWGTASVGDCEKSASPTAPVRFSCAPFGLKILLGSFEEILLQAPIT